MRTHHLLISFKQKLTKGVKIEGRKGDGYYATTTALNMNAQMRPKNATCIKTAYYTDILV